LRGQLLRGENRGKGGVGRGEEKERGRRERERERVYLLEKNTHGITKQ